MVVNIIAVFNPYLRHGYTALTADRVVRVVKATRGHQFMSATAGHIAVRGGLLAGYNEARHGAAIN